MGESKFSFSMADMRKETKNLEIKNAGIFSNIPARQLKPVKKEIVGPFMQIWNHEIFDNQNFPSKLKFPDISPIFKKLECILKENNRPVSVLPVVSKIFERVM